MKRDRDKQRAWEQRSRKPLKRSGMKRSAPKRRGRDRNGQPHDIIDQTKIDQHRRFQQAAQHQRVCQRCGNKGEWHPHHVVYKQWLERHNRVIDDPDNALRLCPNCHAGHHYGTPKQRVALKQLKTCNLRYAFREMGEAAGSYLRRRYRGDDPRLDEIEAEHAT